MCNLTQQSKFDIAINQEGNNANQMSRKEKSSNELLTRHKKTTTDSLWNSKGRRPDASVRLFGQTLPHSSSSSSSSFLLVLLPRLTLNKRCRGAAA